MKKVLISLPRPTILLAVLAVLLVGTGCQKEEIRRYELKDSAMVFKATSSAFSLKGMTDPKVILSVPVQLVGPIADYDRPIQIVVKNDEKDIAQEGVDFKILSSVLKAGEMQTTIDLEVKEFPEGVERLSTTLSIEPNEHFILGYPAYSSVKVSWSEEYVRPSYYVWRDWFNFFSRGYSRNYHELMVDLFGEEIELCVSMPAYAKRDTSLVYKNIHWWYGANNRLREHVTKHDREYPDQPLMHSADYEEYSNYETAVGEGRRPEEIPTILSTLNAI